MLPFSVFLCVSFVFQRGNFRFTSRGPTGYRSFRGIVAINRVWPIVGINFESFDATNGHVASAIVRRIYDFRKESAV